MFLPTLRLRVSRTYDCSSLQLSQTLDRLHLLVFFQDFTQCASSSLLSSQSTPFRGTRTFSEFISDKFVFLLFYFPNPDLCDAGAVLYQLSYQATIYGLLIDPRKDQLPIRLIAQLVGHCTGIAEVRVRVPFRPFFRCCLSSIAKLRRSLTLKLFPSAVQMKFY